MGKNEKASSGFTLYNRASKYTRKFGLVLDNVGIFALMPTRFFHM
jgi:hypothetical protein